MQIIAVMGLMILIAAMISVELGVSVAIVEILMGVIVGNLLGPFGLHATPWVDFMAGLGSITLAFLAGAEVDTHLLRNKWKESLLIGGLSFLGPCLVTFLIAYFLVGWSLPASQIAALALSDVSLAVVYAVTVETGLSQTYLGKILMASCFIAGLGTALVLSLMFVELSWWLVPFVAVSVAVILLMPRLHPWFFARYGNRVIEPEIKGAFFVLFMLMFLGQMARSHAILPAFLLGLAVAGIFARHRLEQQRFRVVAFAVLTPFFFIKAGMNVSLGALWQSLGLAALFLAARLATKVSGVLPFAKRYVPSDAWFTTLLMSTGLTFGAIAAFYGLEAGIISQAQFTVLVSVIIASAVLPTFVAQRFFHPLHADKSVEGTAGRLPQEEDVVASAR